MSNTHHQSREEQINNRLYAAVRLHQDKMANQENTSSMSSGYIQRKRIVDDGSIQHLARQIYLQKGGNALDNWLEAERILKNNDPDVSDFLTEGNPNIKNIKS